VIRGAYLQYPDYSLHEDLVTSVDVKAKPFTLTYHIKPQAVWNDGVPVTADDFIFTAQTFNNKKNDMATRTGYDQIKSMKKINAKTVQFGFKSVVAAWKILLFSIVYPSHALKGTDFNKDWATLIDNPKTHKPISDGPFMMQNWTKGQSLTLVRNPKWWGAHQAYLDKVVYKFIENSNSEIEAVRGGEVQAIYPQPQLALAPLRSQSNLTTQSNAGPILEHIDFQMGPHGGPLERAPWVRAAISYAIDRSALVKQLFKTLAPSLPVLQSLVYASSQKEYKGHFQRYTYNPTKVGQLMQAHGCTKGGDGIWSCQGQRMSYGVTYTAGNALRSLAFEIIQAQAKAAGIELKDASGPSQVVFGPNVFEAGNFDLFMYAWQTNGDPSGWLSIYDCPRPKGDGDQNFKGYCSTKVQKVLQSTNTETDEAKRAAATNTADALMANGLPAIPLYLKPTFFVYSKKLQGAVDNPTSTGFTWKIEDWWLSK